MSRIKHTRSTNEKEHGKTVTYKIKFTVCKIYVDLTIKFG